MCHIASILVAIALGAASAGAGNAQTSVDIRAGDIVLRGGWLFDATGDARQRNTGIVIRNGALFAVGADLRRADLSVARVIDVAEQETVVPGFFDLHAHYAVDLFGEGRVDEYEVNPVVFLANGVTSTFPAGEVDPEGMRAAREAIAAGTQPGPRLEALIGQAHRHGLTVTGHLDSGFRNSVNPRDAILMGIDRIEHFSGGDAIVADRSAYASLEALDVTIPAVRKQFRLFLEHGVFYDATITAYGYFGERDPEIYTRWYDEMALLTPHAQRSRPACPGESMLSSNASTTSNSRRSRRSTMLAVRHTSRLGTDHPSWGEFFSGFGPHRELHALVKAGLPPAAALRIATINGARALGVSDRLGTLEPGKYADLVIVRGNPLEDIRTTHDIRLVIRAGEVFDPEKLLDSVRGTLGPASTADEHRWKGTLRYAASDNEGSAR
ncbi:MAG: amidohydrolase family protein [Longimicrobiales bacterium]